MTSPVEISFAAFEDHPIAQAEGAAIIFLPAEGPMGALADAADAATGGAVARLRASSGFKGKPGDAAVLAHPGGLKAEKLIIAALGETAEDALRAGAAAAARIGEGPATIYADFGPEIEAELAAGLALRLYRFDVYKGAEADKPQPGPIAFASETPEATARAASRAAAVVEGVFFTRDLVNEPANVLTTDEFAARLAAMQEIGLDVEILGEPELEKLGMRCLLAVGRGSESESKVVVMRWNGGGDEAPLALVGKGVVFDTGGISLKPGASMEDMTMDMGGAGVVSGVMRALALRKARANVVGVVGLVENMPDARAQRPGDIVKSMKGDTVEVINTDAEGRMVLADLLWHTQEAFKPKAMIDLATLTGAVIVALGSSHAGYFATDDALADAFAGACRETQEKAWRMPLHDDYDKMLKSRLADMRNSCGREAGSVTAAQFLKRFVKEDQPWLHIDIAGVTLAKKAGVFAPEGATGWGVRALDHLVSARFET